MKPREAVANNPEAHRPFDFTRCLFAFLREALARFIPQLRGSDLPCAEVRV